MSSATSSSRTGALAAPLGASALAGLDAGAIGYVLPAMRAATGADAALASALVSGFVAASLLAVPAAALLARRVAPARLLRAALALAGLAAALALLAPGVHGVLAARALQGLAHGPLLPLAAAVLVLQAPPGRQGRWLGLQALAYGLAFLIATAGTPFVLQAGWRAAFGACGALALALALLPARAAAPAPPVQAAWRALAVPALLPVGAVAIGTGIGQALLVWLPTLAAARLGLALTAAALPMLALVAGGLGGTALVTLRLDRNGARPLAAAGALAALAGLLLAAAVPPSPAAFAAGALALGFGTATLSGGPLRWAAARVLPPAEQGPAQGLVAWLTNLGLLGGSLLVGALAARGPLATALLAAGAAMALALAAAVALPRR